MDAERNGAPDVVAIGEVLVDFVAPEAEDLVEASVYLRAAGGAPANVAVAAARLGASAGFIGAVGKDPFGAYVKSVLAANGVDLSALQTVEERTTLAFVARNVGGIPDFVFYRGADTRLRAEDLPRDILGRTSFLHASSLPLLMEPSAGATMIATRLAHEAGTLVSVDPNFRPSSWPSPDAARETIGPLLLTADVLKVNEEEARVFSGATDLVEAMAVLGNEESLLIVTMGADGCLWRWKGETGHVPAPTVEVVDTTGAGDAFVGALLTELCARGYTGQRFGQLGVGELEGALRFACVAGALACTRPGAMTSLPTREEVDALLHA